MRGAERVRHGGCEVASKKGLRVLMRTSQQAHRWARANLQQQPEPSAEHNWCAV